MVGGGPVGASIARAATGLSVALVAHQRPVSVGATVASDYVVTSGLKAGDKVIVAGVQKIGDGVPVSGGR